MKTLNILWQRLVTPEGETCERCGGTQAAIAQVIPKLREALRPLGIEPVLEAREIALDAFKGCHPNPTGSGLPGARLKTG